MLLIFVPLEIVMLTNLRRSWTKIAILQVLLQSLYLYLLEGILSLKENIFYFQN